ncbi:MAG: thioredoxin-disulfide reductase [Phototrophicales bacterium]|nr:MAG: thioredoxin-disulfide reductase [Phototrophicales bacterium]
MQREKVVIVGSGPAGLTAALYTARAQLNPLVLVGPQLGGQAGITHEIENYPGFPEGVGGAELVERMRAQAERFGTRYVYSSLVEADFSQRPFYLKDDVGQEYLADSVIITSGASPRKLGVKGEEELTGYGVSYCGTCDGFFFRGKDIVVVGGGDSALEEGIFLTRFANKVEIIHRRDELRAGAILQKRAFENEKISFIWNTVVEEIIAGESGTVEKVRLRNVKTNEVWEHPTQGVFIFIGHEPNNHPYLGQITMEDGYIITDQYMRTNIEGVFAAGEIQDPIYRQVATSVGQGTAAAMSLERWLSAKEAEEAEKTEQVEQ